MSNKRTAVDSRYIGKATAPANGTPSTSQHVDLAFAMVPDPYNPERKTPAAINRRVDLLELERSRHLISEAAYRVGRELQRDFERAPGIASCNWEGGDRGDPAWRHELQLVRGKVAAEAIHARRQWTARVLGHIDARLVWSILGDNQTYDQAATARGKSGERGQRYMAARFRDALEELAKASAARGKETAPAAPEPNYTRHRDALAAQRARQKVEGATAPGRPVAATRAITA